MRSYGERFASLHWPLVIVVVSIGILGIYNLHSAAAARDPDLYLTQLVWFSLGALFAVALLAPDYRVTESLAYVFYAVVCLLLIAVLLQGKEAGGARRWLLIGPVPLQPSELAKIAVVLCLARYFSHRTREDGHSVASLFRPLNPSRPLAVIMVLALFWNKPWMVDPIGELARFIHQKPIAPPGDLLWLRIALIASIIGFGITATAFLRVLERQHALLNPWPDGRFRRLVGLIGLCCSALGAVLWLAWSYPAIMDPFGVLLFSLHKNAAPGGPYEALLPGSGLRVIVSILAAIYGGASAVYARNRLGTEPTVDLLIAPIDLVMLPALLILVEPDLGTAGVVVFIGLGMILVVGVRFRSILSMGILGAAVAAVAWFGVLKDYQKRRILTFIDPEHDIKGAGWNAVQSMIAVGSGRWWGKGHMGGTQSQLSFLPEQHTDFAVSVWAEEQGFVGCLIVLALYLLLLYFALTIAIRARDTYGALLAAGVASIVFWHTLINVGMVIGMLPVVGLTLPLFSYGGSSAMVIMMGVGILLNVHWRRLAG